MKKATCIISGGMDSTICAYIAKDEGYSIVALHFDYGQRTMQKERDCFYNICNHLGVIDRYCLDINFLKTIGHNALTDTSMPIIESRELSNANSMDIINDFTYIPSTYVPFRNGIFLSIAGSVAEVQECEAIFIGVIQDDNIGYPDCSELFIQKAQHFINEGRSKNIPLSIQAPLLRLDKAQIVKLGIQKNVPLNLTWSCYQNNNIACGVCDSCVMRLRGFREAGYIDPIAYTKV